MQTYQQLNTSVCLKLSNSCAVPIHERWTTFLNLHIEKVKWKNREKDQVVFTTNLIKDLKVQLNCDFYYGPSDFCL